MNLTNYRSIYASESMGSYGSFGIDIRVAGSHLPPNLDQSVINHAVYDAVAALENAIRGAAMAADPAAQARAGKERADLLALFPTPIFVEAIPNGYASGWHSKHLPWFVVTTSVGRITVGWRKRVISIDWSQTVGTKTSAELFAAEDVTKGERDIHAWSYDKAREYIAAILASAKV